MLFGLRPSLIVVALEWSRRAFMPSYQSCRGGGSFQHFLRGFLQHDRAAFRAVLTEEQLKRTAEQAHLSFGTGTDDIYTVPLTLWACGAHVVSEQRHGR